MGLYIQARKNRGLSEQPLDSVGDYKYDSPADNSQFIPDHGSLDDDDDDDAEPLNNDSCHSTTNPELHDEAHGELEMVAAPSFKVLSTLCEIK